MPHSPGPGVCSPMPHLQDVLEKVKDRFPTKRGDQIKLIAAVSCLSLCTAWLLYLAISSMSGSGPARPLDTPGWRIVEDLNKKLASKIEFNDVNFTVASERPLKLKVVGMVHTQDLLDDLGEELKSLRPEQDYEVDVVILNP